MATMRRTAFDLPEVGGWAYVNTATSVCAQVHGSPSYIVRDYFLDLMLAHVNTVKFRFEGTNRVLHVNLNQSRCTEFCTWLSENGVRSVTPTYVWADDGTYAYVEKFPDGLDRMVFDGVTSETCPECYGTGFHKGFGAPCARGCSS